MLLSRKGITYCLLTITCSIGTLLAPYYWGDLILPRTEELNYSLYPLVIWARQLLSGTTPFWFSDAGLGVPWPIPHTMSHTPLVSLFAILPVYKALSVLLAVHIAIQAFFIIRICDYFQLSLATSLVVLCSVLLAAPIEYLVSSDAAAVFMSWTLLPAILYSILKIIQTADRIQSLGYAVILGIATGYGILNGHLGVFSTHVMGIALIAIFQPQSLMRKWYLFLIAAIISIGIGAEKIYALLHELSIFGENSIRMQYSFEQKPAAAFWNLFLKPLVLSINTPVQDYWNILIKQNMLSRTFTFGSPLCSILLISGFIRFLKGSSLNLPGSLERAMWLTLSACFLIQFIPTNFLPVFISASWTFRDVGILIALFLAGILCDQWLRKVISQTLLNILMSLHVILVICCALIFTFGSSWLTPTAGIKSDLYNQISINGGNFPLQQAILKGLICTKDSPNCSGLTKRVAYDGLATNAAHYGKEVGSGLHLNALPLNGIQELNYLTKGLSLDSIHPSQSTPYGMITTRRFNRYTYQPNEFDWVQESPALVNLLGIRFIVGEDSPIYKFSGLEKVDEIIFSNNYLALYKNHAAFPRAFFVSSRSLSNVQLNSRCPESATHLTCMNVSSITENTDPWQTPINVQDSVDAITLSFKPSNQARIILMTTMWRPEWRAISGELSNFHGLMQVSVPANLNNIRLDYVPYGFIKARIVSIVCFILALITLLFSFIFWPRFKNSSSKI